MLALIIFLKIEKYSPQEKKIIKSIAEYSLNGNRGDKETLAALSETANLSQFEMYTLASKGLKQNIAKNPHISMYTMNMLA